MPRFLNIVLSISILIQGISQNTKAQSSIKEDTSRIVLEHSYEYIPDVTEDVLQDRLSCIENEIPLTYNNRVKAFIDYFTVRDREYTKKVARLAPKYFPLFEKYLAEYGLPDELKYLAIVESGLNPKIVSHAGAVGLWQFMPLTGRLDYDLSEDWYLDEKMDPEKATEAACRYLSFLYRYFHNDWELALAAYNSGPGNVRKAIRRSGYKKSFWEIYPYLYRETRSYLPQFIAVTYTMKHLEEHNFIIEDEQLPIEHGTVEVKDFVNLKLLAESSNICLETLEDLNPEIKRSAIPSYVKQYALRVPIDKKEWIEQHKDSLLLLSSEGEEHWQRLARNTVGSTYGRQKLVYTVKSGDVLGKIANRYDVRIADIRSWNNLRGSMIRVGQRIDIWIADNYYDDVNEKLEALSKQNKKPIKDGDVYYVQPGDTLWDISRKFKNLTVDKIKKLNNLNGNGIKPGQALIIG
jgi:membrane-bound lytic murein transglycosylase D